MMRHFPLSTAFAASSLLAASVCFAQGNISATFHVDGDAATAGDGSSWAQAFNTIQSAMSAAHADRTANPGDITRIFIKAGTYDIDAFAGENENLILDDTVFNGLELYGGFAGTETDPAERTAILAENSTTINATNGRPLTIGDANADEQFTDIRVDGLVLTGGLSGSSAGGGGLFITNGDETVVIANTRITENNDTAVFGKGGGVVINWRNAGGLDPAPVSNPQFINVEITNNFTARDNSDISGGGGVFIFGGASASFTDCLISGNGAGGRRGGGVHIQNGANADFVNTVISNNAVGLGADGTIRGGGVFLGGTATFENCAIIGNTAYQASTWNQGGAGIYVLGTSTDPASATFTNSIISGNRLPVNESRGGGVYADADSTVDLVNCIVSGNYVRGGSVFGSALYSRGAATTVTATNCTFDRNRTLADSTGVIRADADSTIAVRNSIISYSSTPVVASTGGAPTEVSNVKFTNNLAKDSTEWTDTDPADDPMYVHLSAEGITGTWATVETPVVNSISSRATTVLVANGTPFAGEDLSGRLLMPRDATYRHVRILSNTDNSVTVDGDMVDDGTSNDGESFNVAADDTFHVLDYRLADETSGAIGRADNALAPAEDIIGTERPQGDDADAGAYEFIPDASVNDWTLLN